MAEPNPSQYDAFASEFETHAEAGPYNALYDRPATLKLLGNTHGKRVFDAACGPGFHLAELIDSGAEVSGCDASEPMITMARRRVGPDIDLRVHSLEAPCTWIDDQSTDLVLCALAHHHITNRIGFLKDMHRILRPDGAVVLSTVHPTEDWLRLGGSYFEVASYIETWQAGWDVAMWRMPLTQIASEFFEAGFVIERLVEPSPTPEMEDRYPTTYEKLTARPTFILFRLTKRQAS